MYHVCDSTIHPFLNYRTVVDAKVSRLDSRAWIGLGDVDLDGLLGKYYVWSDNTAVSFFNWGGFGPAARSVYRSNLYRFTAVCVTMSSGTGTWKVDYCGKKLPFVCKRRYNKVTPLAAGGCPPDFFIFGSKCFLIRSTVGYDFGTARNSCIQYGTGFDLASIISLLEQMVLVLRMRETGGSSAFIGLKDLHLDGQYDWLDNSPASYTNFRAGQPSLHMMEHCVEMFSDGTWNSLNCASLRGFICQGPRDSDLSEPTPSVPTSHCPVGYTVYSSTEQCYRILNSSQSWKESLTLCQVEGATLATIEDFYDMYFLEILRIAEVPSESPIWIGLADFKGTGVFQWVSGATVTYTKWVSGEPRLKENTCAAIHKGFWRQVSCDISQPAICQAVRKVLGMSLRAGQIAGIIIGSVTAFVILGVFIYVYVHGRCRHIPLFCQETYVQPTVPGNNDHVYESVEMANIYETIDC